MSVFSHPALAWPATAALFALLLAPSHAQAGKGRDNCVGWIDSLPAQLNKQGTWCMRGDLTTATVDGGGGIQINLNNVVVDCNGYRIENTTPGNRSTGVMVSGNNHVIRNCDVRGFFQGLASSGLNNTIEDNLFQDLGAYGIRADVTNTVRRNHVIRVGGDPTHEGHIAAIIGGGDIFDNLVDTVFANPTINRNGFVSGITTRGGSGVVARNRVRNLMPAGNGWSRAIEADGRHFVQYNHIVGPALGVAGHYSIYCFTSDSHARDNIASGFAYTWTSGNTSGWVGSIACDPAGGSNVDKL